MADDGWVTATLRCRHAQIDGDGEHVSGEFDLTPLFEIIVPLVATPEYQQHLFSEMLDNPAQRAQLFEMLLPAAAMELTIEVMGKLSGEQLADVLTKYTDEDG
jgi:hypothetical protein